jgi:putative flavoprotein involved in K+ transport
MRYVTTVIIGAGQSGLAMSKHLTDRSIDHVLLERGEVANSWQMERWDSLRLLTPNWQSRLPGYAYDGSDPDGYMSVTEVVGFLKRYAGVSGAPVQTHTNVTRVRLVDGGYEVTTDQGPWWCPTLVLASGACNIATVPAVSAGLPPEIASHADAVPQAGSIAGWWRVGHRSVGDRRAACTRDQGVGPKRHSCSR